MQLTPVVTISFLLYAGVSGCLSPVEGDNCLLPKQKEWQIIIFLVTVTGLFFVLFCLFPCNEGACELHLFDSMSENQLLLWGFFSAFSNLPVAGADIEAAQSSLLPSVTSAQIQSDMYVLRHDLMRHSTSPAPSHALCWSWGQVWEVKFQGKRHRRQLCVYLLDSLIESEYSISTGNVVGNI